MGSLPVDFHLGRERESCFVYIASKAPNVRRGTGLLASELVARKGDNFQSILFVLIVEFLQPFVLWRESTLRAAVETTIEARERSTVLAEPEHNIRSVLEMTARPAFYSRHVDDQSYFAFN